MMWFHPRLLLLALFSISASTSSATLDERHLHTQAPSSAHRLDARSEPTATTPLFNGPVPTNAPSCDDCTNFSGSNLYYAAGLSSDQRKAYLQAMQQAGMKVLRVWLDGQSGSPKGTTITAFPGLEPDAAGLYDDTVLENLDDLMVDAHSYGIKLQISIHSSNSLKYGSDPYGKLWDITTFYTNDTAQAYFDARINHVLAHRHKTLGKQWKELDDYIFAFEPQNEPMIWEGIEFVEAHADWQCKRAKAIKTALSGNNKILVTTGGASWLAESFMPAYLACDGVDIVALHLYEPWDFNATTLRTVVKAAQNAQKKMMVQEWAVCYQNVTSGCTGDGVPDANFRNGVIETFALAMLEVGLPWMYWQVIPNDDPHGSSDYEIGINSDPSWDTMRNVSLWASAANGSFDFAPYLLNAKGPSLNSNSVPEGMVASAISALMALQSSSTTTTTTSSTSPTSTSTSTTSPLTPLAARATPNAHLFK